MAVPLLHSSLRQVKPFDKVVQRHDHHSGNLVTTIERTPGDLDTCGLEKMLGRFTVGVLRENSIGTPSAGLLRFSTEDGEPSRSHI
jgi:hypothetical protein